MQYTQYHSPESPRFSIVIPSWNNLGYLRKCIDSIRAHSHFDHQIIVHVNEGADGTLDYLREAQVDHTFSPKNIGICYAVNAAVQHARADQIVFLNDDMYVLPGWDKPFADEIGAIGHDRFMLSGTMIEHTDTGNACVIVADYGKDLKSFREEALLKDFATLKKADWSGATWPPVLISRRMWNMVGGFSVEFSPGMSSDPDLSMKLWHAGVSYFKGLGQARVYHFQAKSTGRITKNKGNKQFLRKWGITQSTFFRYYLRRGEAWKGPLEGPDNSFGYNLARLKARVKRFFS